MTSQSIIQRCRPLQWIFLLTIGVSLLACGNNNKRERLAAEYEAIETAELASTERAPGTNAREELAVRRLKELLEKARAKEAKKVAAAQSVENQPQPQAKPAAAPKPKPTTAQVADCSEP